VRAIGLAPILCSALLAATLFAAPADPASHTIASDSDDADIARVSEVWAEAWSAKDLDRVVGLYADDAQFLPSTGTRIDGKPAIRALFEKAMATSSAKLSVRSWRTESLGDLGYDSGEYSETYTANGVTTTGSGCYLVVLRRVRGTWRIVQHMWTDVPAKK